MATTGYTPQELISRKLKLLGADQERAITSLLFGQSNTHAKNIFTKRATNAYVRRLAVVPPNAPALPIDKTAGTTYTFKAPKIFYKATYGEADAEDAFVAGTTDDLSLTNLNDALMERMAFDLLRLRESAMHTKEVMCTDLILTGVMNLPDESGTTVEKVDFGYTTGTGDTYNVQPALSGTDVWDDKSNGEPLDTLNTLEKQIRQNSGYGGPLIVLCGRDVEAALRKNSNVQNVLDNRRMEYGELYPRSSMNAYIGSLDRWDIFVVDTYTMGQSGSTASDLFNPKKLAMVPRTGIYSIEYGACWGRNGWEQVEERTEQRLTPDPWQIINEYETRPLPFLDDVTPIRIQQVVS